MGLVDCLYDLAEKYSMVVLFERKSSVILKFNEPRDLLCWSHNDNTPTERVAWREYFVIRLHCAAGEVSCPVKRSWWISLSSYICPGQGKRWQETLLFIKTFENGKVQPVFEKFFWNILLTYRTDVRIISAQSKIKMSMGRDAGGATISRNRSAELLRKCGMRSSRPGSSQNQSSCGRSGTEL